MTRSRLAGWMLALGLGLAVAVVAGDARDAFAQEADPNAEPVEKPPEGPSLWKTLASYGLALLAVGLMIPPLTKASEGNVQYPAAKLQLINLLRSNPYQAVAVCKSLKGTFYEPLGAALVTGGTTQSQDPRIIATATRPTYDGVAGGVAAGWKALLGKGKLGMMAAAGGIAIALTGGSAPIIVILIGAVAIAMFGWLFYRKTEADRVLLLARAEILPEVERAIADGRYVAPPPAA